MSLGSAPLAALPFTQEPQIEGQGKQCAVGDLQRGLQGPGGVLAKLVLPARWLVGQGIAMEVWIQVMRKKASSGLGPPQ